MKSRPQRRAAALVMCVCVALAFLTQGALAATFTVDWSWGPDDIGDTNPGDGVCSARKFVG